MEQNPVVCIKNNVFGTWNLLNAAHEAGVKRFVLISTDKVVSPASVYGVSKKLAEAMVLSWPVEAGQEFMAVRFGNVLGSRGSIVPLFRDQIQKGGPITITDPAMCRFFMTIPEAASLVLKSGGVGENGRLYLLDMGEPLLIKDLAETMIRFYGYTPHEDIKLQYIGLREGEKLFETLHESYEDCSQTPYPRILGVSSALDWLKGGEPCTALEARSRLEGLMADLNPICFLDPSNPDAYRNRRLLRATLAAIIPSLPQKPDEREY
jgi:FlaA1/EpsC-like NDP-sugar epimerase